MSALVWIALCGNLFARSYWADSAEYAMSLTRTPDNGYVVVGKSNSFGASGYDFMVMRTDAAGDVVWAKTFGGGGNDLPYSVINTLDGGFAVAGITSSFGAGSTDVLLLKLGSDGTLMWSGTIGGPGNDYAYSLIQTPDSGFILAGETSSYGAGGRDVLVVKTNASGTILWARTFGGAGTDIAKAVIPTSDGGYALAGATTSFGAGDNDVLLMKITSSGALTWAVALGDTLSDQANALVQTSDGGFALAGSSYSYGTGSVSDVLVIRTDPAGNPLWATVLGGLSRSDGAYSLAQAPDSGLVVAGYTNNFGAGQGDFLFFKLGTAGALAWCKTFGSANHEYGYAMLQEPNGDLAMCGRTGTFATSQDFMMVKTDSTGTYTGCAVDCVPRVLSPSPNASSSPDTTVPCTPSTSSPNLSEASITLNTTDYCTPMEATEAPSMSGSPVLCSPVPGGALFVFPDESRLSIYSVDGRDVFSEKVARGEIRIHLRPGVYLWRAGPHRGRVAVPR